MTFAVNSAPEPYRTTIAELTKQCDRYITAMLWMRDQDPQMVDAAVEKFELDLDGPTGSD